MENYLFNFVDIDEKKMVDIEEEIRSLQLDSAGTIGTTHKLQLVSQLVRYCSLFEYFCLSFIWNLAEDYNGGVNADDSKHEEPVKVDTMEEGWYSHIYVGFS